MALALVCVMLPAPAVAKRQSLEGYYASRRDVSRNKRSVRSSRSRHHSSRADNSKPSVSQDTAEHQEQGALGAKAPVPFVYVIGNVIADTLSGALSSPHDRFCQPITLQYLQRQP